MSIEANLKSQLIAAMKAKDTATAGVIKMIRSKIMEKKTSKDFSGEINDALCVEIIAAYKKTLEKARLEFEKAGERGAASVLELQQEITFCQQFLPAQMNKEEVTSAVQKVLAELGDVNEKMTGRIVGAVMKEHKGKVEAALVKTVVAELLSA